jgi:WD40 repeat protein/tetratricopeptide (TPR) repeat protein
MRTMFEAMSSLFAREAWFGRDGQHVSLHKLNGQVVTWDTRTGAALAATDPVGLVLSSAYRPDGQQMAVLRMRLEEKDLNKITSDITVPEGDQIGLATGMVRALFQGDIVELSLHEVKKGKVAVELEEPLCWLCAPAYSGDGRLLAAASLSHVKVWDTTTGKIRLKLAQAPGLVGSHFAFSADGRWLVVGSARTKNIGLDKAEQTAGPVVVVLIDLKTGKEQRRWTPACTRAGPLVFSPDSRLLVLPGKDPVMELREVESGALRATLPGHVHAPFLARISPDGALLATASWDGSVRLWSMETGKLVLVLRGHTRPIQGIAFHPDGKRLVSSSSLALSLIHRGDTAGEVKLWDVASGRELLTLDGMGPVYFSPDGTCLIATGQSFTSRVWSGATLTEAEQAHRRQVWEQGKTDWHTREALAAKEAKQWQTVVFHLSRLIEVDSNNRFLHGERGSAHRELEQYDKARSDFGRVIEIAPRAGFAWYARRGWMSMELGDTDRAIEDLNIAVSMDHKDTFTRALRGRAWLAKEEWQKAIDDLNLAIAADKKEGHYLAQRGQAFAGLGKWKEAEEDVRQALKRIKEANWLHEELAVLRLAQGDVDGYRRILREIITRHEKSPTPEEASGLIFSAIRVPDVLPAESLLRLMFRASEAKTKPVSQVNGEEQMQQGAVYYRAGLFAAARDRLLEAEKARGKSPSALDSFFLALCHQRLRNADQARAAYARGVRLVEEAEKSKALNWEQRLNRRLLRQEVEDTLQVKP